MDRQSVLGHIEELVEEEERLYAKEHIEETDRARLHAIQIDLDRCWDLLRQRQALRSAGKNPDQAEIRDEQTVEKYLQ